MAESCMSHRYVAIAKKIEIQASKPSSMGRRHGHVPVCHFRQASHGRLSTFFAIIIVVHLNVKSNPC